MTTRRILEIAAFCAALLLAALAVHAWLASRDDQQRLESTLSTQKQIIDAATADQQTSEAKLKDTLAQIDKLKSATQTPEQILRELPKYLPLPEPIRMVGGTSAASGATAGAGAKQQQGIATSQFPTAANAAKSSESAKSESSKPPNSNSADTLPAASSAAADQSPGSRLRAFLNFFRDAGKAKPVRSSPPSPVCQPETSASIADPAASGTSPKSTGSNSSHGRIPDSAAAPAGNFSAGKTNPAASPSLSESESTEDASPKSSDSNSNVGHARDSSGPAGNSKAGQTSQEAGPSVSESTDDGSPKSPGSNPDIEHSHDFNGRAGSSKAGKTRQAAVPCVPETPNDGANNAKARQPTSGVGTRGLKLPPAAAAPQLPAEPDTNAPQSALGIETPGTGLPAEALAGQAAPDLDGSAEIPAADLKPLFDYIQDCRSCDAQLKAANQVQADSAAKILALTKERDAAITAGKGGTFLLRLRRNALWFAAGAAVGVTAAITAHAAALR